LANEVLSDEGRRDEVNAWSFFQEKYKGGMLEIDIFLFC